MVELVAAGLRYPRICAAVGIDVKTLAQWRAKAAEGHGEYADAIARMVEAEREWEVSALNTIKVAGTLQWQACAWLLQRRWPETYVAPMRYAERRAELRAQIRSDADRAETSAAANVNPEAMIRFLIDFFPDTVRKAQLQPAAIVVGEPPPLEGAELDPDDRDEMEEGERDRE